MVDTLFHQLSVSSWKRNLCRPQSSPVIAYNQRLAERSQSLSIDDKALKASAGKKFSGHQAFVLEILSKKRGSEIEAMFQRGILRISASALAEIVFSFLAAMLPRRIVSSN